MADLLFGLTCVRHNGHDFIDIMIEYFKFTAIKSFALATDLAIEYNTNLIGVDLLRKTNCYYALKPIDQVLIALQFYASGALLQVVGDTTGVDKSTVSLTGSPYWKQSQCLLTGNCIMGY